MTIMKNLMMMNLKTMGKKKAQYLTIVLKAVGRK